MVGSGKPTQGGAGVWGRPRMVDQVFGLGEDRGDPNQTDKIQPMVPTRCPSDRSTAFRIGISDPKLATLVSVSDRNARREPAAGVAPIQIPRSPTHPASGRASSYPEAPVARGPYDRRESRPVIHAGRTHARTHHTGGSHLTSAINRCRKSDTQFIPQIRGYQLRLEPPRTSIRRPAGPGSRPRRILTSSDSGLPDPTEPAGYTQPGRFKAARRRGVSPGRLSLRRTRVAATIHHPTAQAAGGNRRSPERTEKSYPPGLKASICEAPGVRGRTPGALGRPHLPTRIARTRGGSQATVDLSPLSSSAPVHQNTNTQHTNLKQTNTVIESIQTLQLASGISPRTGAFQRGPNDHAERYAAPSPTVPACCNPLRIRELRPNRPINKHPADTRLRASAGGDEPAFHQRLTPGPRDRPAW